MNLLITGATGFIGSRLALHCLEAGHSVRVLGIVRNDQERATADLLESKGAQVHVVSVADRERLAEALDGVDVVIHLAAAQHEANVPDQHFHDVNVEGTRNMLDAAVSAGIRRFVHGSSIGVYGGGGTLRNDSPLEPDNIYGITKLGGEEVVRSYDGKIEYVICRIAETYGPGDLRLIKLFKGVQKGRFPMIGRGDNLHHLIYIDDLIEAFLLAGTRDGVSGETYVLAGERPTSTRDMVAAVAKELGKSPPWLKVPMGPVMLVANLMQAVCRPLGIQPPLHPRRINFYRKSFDFSMEETRETLGFQPRVDFEVGAAQTARWYREQGILP